MSNELENYLQIIDAEGTEGVDIDELVNQVFSDRYDHTAPAPPTPDYLFSINGNGIALPGSLIGIYGPPKSRKSSLMAMFAAAALADNKRYGSITSTMKGSVLWIDTEQSATEVKYFQDNLIRMSGVTDDDFIREHHFCLKLRPFDEMQRLAIIDRIVTAPNVIEDIGVIFLDGIADLMYNVNDIEMSKKLVTRITYWADKLQVPVFVALHTNKDGKDATGSLGGFANKKASYTIKTEPTYDDPKVQGPSIVYPYYTRNGQNFRPFKINNYGDNHEFPGMPYIVGDATGYQQESVQPTKNLSRSQRRELKKGYPTTQERDDSSIVERIRNDNRQNLSKDDNHGGFMDIF